MTICRRTRIRLCVAMAAGITTSILEVKLAHAQQSPNDQTVFLNANDSTGASSFFGGPAYQWAASTSAYSTTPLTNATVLSAGSAPTAGYAYVVTGSGNGTGQLRTQVNGSTGVTFAGDSLTIVPYNAQANLYNTSTAIINAQDKTAGLFIYGNTSGQTINVPNLCLANGGAVINSNIKATSLNGNIYLYPAGTSLDGVSTTVSGGIIDSVSSDSAGLTVNATLNGSGQLHILATGGSSASTLNLNGSNGNFAGGVLLDNTVGSGSGTGVNPVLNINTPTALGNGTFTIGSNNSAGVTIGTGPTIDNKTGADETLSTNNTQQWNGPFNFTGTNSLNMGSGTVTLGANSSVTLANNILFVNSIAGSSYSLTVNGSTPVGGALEVPTFASINVSSLSVGNGGTLALTAAQNTPAQFSAAAAANPFATSGALLGIDTTGVTGGVYNMSAGLPGGSYGINKLGSGTLLLSGTNNYTGYTIISNGTLQLDNAGALGATGDVNLGSNFSVPNGTLDVNGFAVTLAQPTGGAKGGLITNNSPTPAVITLVPTTLSFIPNSSYFGNVGGNLSMVVNFPAVTSSSAEVETLNGTNSYNGTTTLQSGVLSLGYQYSIPSAPQQMMFTGGTLQLGSSGLDPSAAFNQSAGQLFSVLVTGTDTFASSINSSGGSLTVGNIAYGPSGTLALAGTNNYSGATSVNVGTLEVANARALAETSVINVNGIFANPNIAGSSNYFSTLQVSDNSGLAGLNNSGGAITTNVSGLGSLSSTITYRTGVTNHTAGYAYYGALQGTAGASDTWAGDIVLTNSPVAISGGFNNASTGGVLILSGSISGTGPLILGLNSLSTTVLAASNSYSGETQINCSTGKATTVQLGANFGIPSDSGLNFSYNPAYLNISSTYAYGTQTFDLNGYNTSVAYITSYNAANVITNTKNGSTSTLTILGSNGTSYLGAFKDGSPTAKLGLAFTVSGVFDFAGGNNYSGGTTVNSGNLVIPGLSNAGTGNLTVNGGEMVIQSSSSATAATLFNMLHTGFNGGNWNGSGVNSATAGSDTTHLTAVGMLTGSTETFEGQSLNLNDVALKLTYYGDANLDGMVDGSDYSLIDNAYLADQLSPGSYTGWQSGDFNYDGVIDGSDYTLIDNAFNSQGAQFTTEIASATAQVAASASAGAVPEPAALSLLAFGTGALLGRRRRCM